MSIRNRLERLEGKLAPPYEPDPRMDLLLKTVNHARAELDTRDAGAEPPEPLVLTLEEKRLDLEAAEHFLPYLDDEWKRTQDPDTLRALGEAKARTRAKIAELRDDLQEGEHA